MWINSSDPGQSIAFLARVSARAELLDAILGLTWNEGKTTFFQAGLDESWQQELQDAVAHVGRVKDSLEVLGLIYDVGSGKLDNISDVNFQKALDRLRRIPIVCRYKAGRRRLVRSLGLGGAMGGRLERPDVHADALYAGSH